ncbi:hypothetical protein QUB68_24420 [Microcoleus sp. A006_D1]|uniref:hypothetical protein n=1 Tax=Microcoleus sp. A006_D1 TaxID=3055267 RepID=UPI002FCED9B6
MPKYIADVNRQGLKTIVVEASSEEEALDKLEKEWEGKIIIPPHLAQSQQHLEAVESEQ